MNPIFSELPTRVFETMSALARAYDAINLGQGFPNDPGPADIRARGARALVEGWNQYPPMMGLPAQATWFLNIDIAGLGAAEDVAFCEAPVREHRVAAIPVSAFYAQAPSAQGSPAAAPVRNLVRLRFAKADATLDAALDRLAAVPGCAA